MAKRERIPLDNGCFCSTPKVFPDNWMTKDATTDRDWYIYYRFYDPLITGTNRKIKPHLEIIKGMNSYKNLKVRREICKELIANELELLQKKGYNPATEQYIVEEEVFYEVHPSTPFIKALKKAMEKVTGVKGTLTDMNCVIRGVEKAATKLRFTELPINQVSRKHIKAILEACGAINKRFSASRHNKYRAYLMRLFKELVAMEAIDINPIRDVQMKTETKKIRLTLTREQRGQINEKLKKERYEFWRFLQIFFHSGSRETELMKVQGKHIDLAGQRCLYTIMKGREIREVWRPIKNVILELWQEAMVNCGPDDYLFSRKLVPGAVHIRPDQITRRWMKYVKGPVNKGGMNIQADFYSLKHLNLDETTELLGIDDAAKMAGHTSTVITMSTYAVGEKARQAERLKKVNNSF